MQNVKSLAIDRFLIIGLGNPGKTYETTRHNIGFRVLKTLAKKYEISFRPSLFRAKGSVGEGMIAGKQVLLLMPLTYMNESGLSVKRCIQEYKIPKNRLLVVVDDVAIPFGTLRLRAQGSSGGHNGLKSVEAHLGGQEYARLRVGVSDRDTGSLADYVLSQFTDQEEELLPSVLDQAIQAIEGWLVSGGEEAMKEVGDCSR